ncbi:hypothetical protein NDU88_009073 [Pleurodeles waltl]|uniref:Uncharacterized protein n=1 Tax=Pleurodeles waltl TaxID=8319 RepID=A0AAV7RZG6_PLEWA|nr:hypothetical protein NDU88_009073 [Pleurodeles waltl]
MDTLLVQILRAIKQSRDQLEQKIYSLLVDQGILCGNHCELNARVVETRMAITAVPFHLAALEALVRDPLRRADTLERRAKDAKGCSRWNNLRPTTPENELTEIECSLSPNWAVRPRLLGHREEITVVNNWRDYVDTLDAEVGRQGRQLALLILEDQRFHTIFRIRDSREHLVRTQD